MNERVIRALLGCALAAGLGCGAASAYAQGEACEVVYRGDEGEVVVPGADLFSHVENGLPGDTFSGRLVIRNESDVPCEFFMVTKDVKANGPEDMLDRIAFMIMRDDDDVLFDDALSKADQGEPIDLGLVEPGSSVEADHVVVIPPELTSEYADAAVGMNVAVTAVERPEDNAEARMEGDEGGAGLAKTGDGLAWLPFALAGAGLVTIGGCAVAIRERGWRR